MSHHIRIKRADQENVFQSQGLEDEGKTTKRPALQQKTNLSNKRLRVPLGGKDHNGKVPSLGRSNTLLEHSFSQKGSTPLAFKPTLTKSNSALGFSHTPFQDVQPVSFQPKPKPVNPLKNNEFPPSQAARPKSLVPPHVSDTISKRTQELPPLTTDLKSTLTLHTTLNSLPKSALYENVDPVKGRLNEEEIAQLAEDPENMEQVPEEPQSLSDTEGLTQADLDFVKHNVTRGEPGESEQLKEELEQEHGQLGLSAAELEDLLD